MGRVVRDFPLVGSAISKSAALILVFVVVMPVLYSFAERSSHQIEAGWCTRAERLVSSLTLEWNRTYGGVDDDEPCAIIQAVDGGYALAGSTYSFGASNGDVWFVRTDDRGNMLWNRTYGGVNTDVAYSLIQTSDGGYALAGTTYSFGAGLNDFWLLKTDSNGAVLWSKTYGGASNDIAMSVVQTVGGDYALVGCTQSFGAGSWDAWLIKTDGSGNMLLNQTYGGTDNDGARSLVQTSDGGFAITGSTVSFSVGLSDFWLIKTDANGIVQWNKTYGGANWDDPYAVVQTSDGGYALAGCSQSLGSGAGDFWLISTDADGNHVWNRTYGGTSEDRPYSLTQTFDGGYALAGYTYSFGFGGSDVWFIKTSIDGNVQWNQTFGGTSEDYARSMVQTSDGSYALAGSTRSFGAGGVDFWLVKTAGESSTIIVPDQYPTIQEAVNNAADGDTIFVRAGTYYEHVVVNKTLSLVGENVSTTIVDGNETGRVIDVVSDNVNITGFTVQRSGNIFYPDLDAGICLDGTTNCTVFQTLLVNNGLGISLIYSHRNTITSNNVTATDLIGIHLLNSSNNTISKNILDSNIFAGINGHASSHHNSINENIIVNSTYGTFYHDASYNTIFRNNISDIAVDGIWLQEQVNHNIVAENNLVNCSVGIRLVNPNFNNTITRNNISMNRYGFYVESSQNFIYHNNVLNNTQQAYVVPESVNLWDNGYPSGGNYWSDYNGFDGDGDGIGDTPYVIDVYNVDRYPLMSPWTQIKADIDGNGTVDLFDAQLLANAFGATPESGNWNAKADLNSDMTIDILDAIVLSSNFGRRT